MMNLKEAFRFQNKLQSVIEHACDILRDPRNTVKVKTTHLRSKVMPDAVDVVVEDEVPSDYAGRANEIAAFIIEMMDEYEKLSRAIHATKLTLDADIDSEMGLNRQRQMIAGTFRRMTMLHSSEKTISGGGIGYRFNDEGNQVSYRCDARQVTTIDFDRDRIRGYAAALSKRSDDMSTIIDRSIVNASVDYDAPFDVNASFDEILTDYLAK